MTPSIGAVARKPVQAKLICLPFIANLLPAEIYDKIYARLCCLCSQNITKFTVYHIFHLSIE
jgi:hypothetical protein